MARGVNGWVKWPHKKCSAKSCKICCHNWRQVLFKRLIAKSWGLLSKSWGLLSKIADLFGTPFSEILSKWRTNKKAQSCCQAIVHALVCCRYDRPSLIFHNHEKQTGGHSFCRSCKCWICPGILRDQHWFWSNVFCIYSCFALRCAKLPASLSDQMCSASIVALRSCDTVRSRFQCLCVCALFCCFFFRCALLPLVWSFTMVIFHLLCFQMRVTSVPVVEFLTFTFWLCFALLSDACPFLSSNLKNFMIFSQKWGVLCDVSTLL